MRRRRMDYEYRDRRDEVKMEQEVGQRRRRQERLYQNQAQEQEQRRSAEMREQQDRSRIQKEALLKKQRARRRRDMERKQRRRSILIVLGLVAILLGAFGFSKLYVMYKTWQGKAETSDYSPYTISVGAAKEVDREEEIINVAVFGSDEEGYHTDVNIVASFHTITKELHLISVPRDTRVVMSPQMTSYLKENGRTVPQQNGVYGQCKLTEVHAYAGEGNRCTLSVAMLEELLDIKMDYYIKVDLTAFKEIVDAIGGVDMEVEQRLYYEDPEQDLYIDLYPGFQHLDGDKAEQLVRYRDGYAQKDLKRIEVQQDFMRTLIEKVCSTDTILKNTSALAEIVLDKTESDITLTDALKYVKYLKDINPSEMTTDTIPGEGGKYFDADVQGTKALIAQRIYGKEADPIEEPLDGQNQGQGQYP